MFVYIYIYIYIYIYFKDKIILEMGFGILQHFLAKVFILFEKSCYLFLKILFLNKKELISLLQSF